MSNTSGETKMTFLNRLGGGGGDGGGGREWSTHPLCQLWTWFQLDADFLRLVLVGSITMVMGGHRCFLIHCNKSFSDWLFYLLILHLYLRNNGCNCILLVCYNKIYIPLAWGECNYWFVRTKFIFLPIGMSVASII